jgi:hypothetical protein
MKIKLLILILSINLFASSYGELLFNGNCITCHSTNELNKSAPTIIEIQNIYKSAFPLKKDFIYYMSTWVLNPNTETSLMDNEIKRYRLMPMLGYDRETLEEISSYLYDLAN